MTERSSYHDDYVVITELASDKGVELREAPASVSRVGFTKPGFTMVSNAILLNGKISMGARFAYATLKSFMYEDPECWPGMSRLSEYLGVTEKTAKGYIDELTEKGLMTKKRRGLNRTNYYTLTDFAAALEAGSVSFTDQEQHISTDLDQSFITDKEYEGKEEKFKNHSVGSEAVASTRDKEKDQENDQDTASSKTTPFSGQTGSQCGNTAKELVSAVLRATNDTGRDFLDANKRKALLGGHFKRLLKNDAPTEDELAWVVQEIASWIECEDEYLSPQRSLREGLRGAPAPWDRDEDDGESDGNGTTDFPCDGCGEPIYWLEMNLVNGESLCDICAHQKATEGSEEDFEGSCLHQPAEGAQTDAQRGDETENADADAALDELLGRNSRTARIAGAAVVGIASPAGPITLQNVEEALVEDLDCGAEAYGLSISVLAKITTERVRRRLKAPINA